VTNPSSEYREAGYRATGLWTDDRVGDLLSTWARQRPDDELFSYEGRRMTYRQFDAWVGACAADLVGQGVGRRDRVLVQLPNCLEALVVQLAAFRIGAVDVPVVPIYREHEMRQILSDCTPAAVAAAGALKGRDLAAELDGLFGDLGQKPLARYVVGAERDGWRSVPAVADTKTALPEPLAAHLPALLLYTSGTTSAPKGALLSSRALFAHLRNFKEILGAGPHTVTLTATPLSHLGGFIAGVVFPAFLGGRSVIMRTWDPDAAVGVIEREGVTLMMGATVFLADLVHRYEQGTGDRHRLPVYACAGAAIPPALIERAERVGIAAVRAYGMTETAGICAAASSNDPPERRREWDGRMLRGLEIEAVDDSRRPLPPEALGQLRIRGPQLLIGYTDGELTKSQLDADGWFYPGDVGGIDAEGWVQVAGRSKDIVNRGGEKFSTMDIELAIASHPAVQAVAVTAVADARLGEGVGAWIVLSDPETWSGPEPLIAHLEHQKLARQKTPTRWHIVTDIPTTASGKVQKHRLAALTALKTWDTTKGPR
jgi:acyl-CoA synthetase (AMP-forming)/AMP-acid ligase II